MGNNLETADATSITTNYQETLNSDAKLANTLLEMSYEALSLDSLDEVLNLLASYTLKILDARLVNVTLLEQNMVFRPRFTDTAQSPQIMPVSPETLEGKGLSGRVYTTGQVAATSDYWNDPTFERSPELGSYAREINTVAALSIPVVLDNKIVAIIGAAKQVRYDWTAEDIAKVTQFGRVAAVVMQKAWLYHELHQLNLQLANQNRQLEILDEYHRRLRGSRDLKTSAEQVLSLAMQIMGADISLLYLVKNSDSTLLELMLGVIPRVNGEEGLQIVDLQTLHASPNWIKNIPLGKGFTGQAAQELRSIVVDDVAAVLAESPTASVDPAPLWRSGVFVPLIADHKLIGAISLTVLEAKKFTSEQVRFIELVASQLAYSIEQMRSLEIAKERDQLAGVLALARTAAHEMSQPLTLLGAELDFVTKFGETPDIEMCLRMQDAVDQLRQQLFEYQKIIRFKTTETVPGISILDRETAWPKQD